MVQTQGSEDRLVILESAVAGLIATSAVRHNELSSQIASLQQQISNMSELILAQQEILKDMQQQKVLNPIVQQKVVEEHRNEGLDNKHEMERSVQKVIVPTFQGENVLEQENKLVQQDKASIQQGEQANQDSTVEIEKVQQDNVEQNSGVTVQPQIKAVEEDENALTNKETPQEWQGYINWDQTYDFLKRHSYFPLNQLTNFISGCLYNNLETEKFNNRINQLVHMLTSKGSPHIVDKTTRFPTDGPYLNINLPAIQFHVKNMINFNDDKEKRFSTLAKLRDVIENIVKNELDGIHNQMSFEEKYKLIWADELEKTDKKHDGKTQKVQDMQLNFTNTLNVQLQQLNSTLSRIEATVSNDNSKQVNTTCKDGYVNWADCHEPIKLHLYVPLESFHHAIKYMFLTEWKPVMETIMKVSGIPWASKFHVNERERFPSNGIFVNVNMPLIKYKLDVLYNARKESYNDKYILTNNLVDFIVDQKCIHNIGSFEEKYKLKWVEKS